MRTRVIQSYRTSDVPAWIETCLSSVSSWAVLQEADYHFVGDEIFDRVPDWYLEKTQACPQIATDLGRLYLMQEAFDEGYDRALWLDADVLVADPSGFHITLTAGFTLGREIWVQTDPSGAGAPRAYRNVHNAYMAFCRENAFLPFYRYACERIIKRMEPGPDKGMAPQVVGPKLLTSLHNTLGFDLSPDIAMLSPEVLADIVNGGGAFLDLFRAVQTDRAFGANLCASLANEAAINDDLLMEKACEALLATPGFLHPA